MKRLFALVVGILFMSPVFATGTDQVLESVLRWNQIAIDASGADHKGAKEQLGPGRSSRAIAITQIAVFEALNAIDGKYDSYVELIPVGKGPSKRAAIAKAAHDALVVMFPTQRAILDAALRKDLKVIRDDRARVAGAILGAAAAGAILQLKAHDGSGYAEELMNTEYVPGLEAGVWRQDPISLIPFALGSKWGKVKPFVLESGKQFRVPPPPALTSDEYTAAFREVKRLGGDGITTPTQRTKEQTFVGIYWGYDGTPTLCAPPRLYNQITQAIIRQRKTSALQTARLLALVNVAMADAGIAIWESKYYYKFWRPVAGIREANAGTGPTGSGDKNPDTKGDPNFSPLGAPASNLIGPNFTPPFPAYPSGHAGFGGALFQVLRRFYGTDDIAFTFVSDEFNGVTLDNTGGVRDLRPRHFKNLSQAEEENGQSRIYLGIHWSFDKTEGITQGQQVGDYVVDHLYQAP